MIKILVILFLFSTLLLTYSILSFIFIRPKLVDRVNNYTNYKKEELLTNTKKTKEKVNLIGQIRKIINIIGKNTSNLLVMKKYKSKIQKELLKANIPLKGEEFVAIQLLIFAFTIVIVFNITKLFILAVIVGILSLFILKLIVNIKKTKRLKQFNDQLGDTIVLISNSLKVGHSFFQALDSAAREMPEPMSKEVRKVINEMKLGVTAENALNNLLNRIDSDDLELVITAVIIQRQTGGNLSEILDTIAKTIRERIKIKGEIKTLTAQGRLSGIIVSLLPIVLGIVIYFIDPDYITILFTRKIGLILLGIALINEIIGYIIINKIVKIDV